MDADDRNGPAAPGAKTSQACHGRHCRLYYASGPGGAEEAKRQTPKWQAIQVDVIQKEITAADIAAASAGRIYVREGTENTEASARIATEVPKGKAGDFSSVKLSGKGKAAKLGPSYMSTLVVTRNADSSIKITHKPSNQVERGNEHRAREVSRDR